MGDLRPRTTNLGQQTKVFASAVEAEAAVADTDVSFDGGFDAIWVADDGDVAVRLLDGATDVVFKGVKGGAFLLVAGMQVRTTSTTATIADMRLVRW